MTGVNFGGGAGVCGVFLTNLTEIGSLDHSCIQITPQSTFEQQINKNKEKQSQRKRKSPSLSLRFLDLDDS